MDELRLILVGVGAIVIIGVYLFGRRRGQQRPEIHEIAEAQRSQPSSARVAPSLPALDEEEEHESVSETEAVEGSVTGGPEQMLVTLHVTFLQPRGLGAVREALEADGMELGEHQVYHRLMGTEGTVFLVANMIEPGVLDGDEFEEIPGLSLFCQLPGPRDPTLAFADVIATARRLASNLGGEVLDSHRSTLTKQTARLIREEIMAFQRRLATESEEQD
jgi:cell division protein ZipA